LKARKITEKANKLKTKMNKNQNTSCDKQKSGTFIFRK